MFDNVIGLRPEEAARLTALAVQCRPVLADEGVEAVQGLLAERGTSIIQAIAITRALLGWEETSLRAAIDIVTASKARTVISDAGSERRADGHGAEGGQPSTTSST